jgi:hypothetical protein
MKGRQESRGRGERLKQHEGRQPRGHIPRHGPSDRKQIPARIKIFYIQVDGGSPHVKKLLQVKGLVEGHISPQVHMKQGYPVPSIQEITADEPAPLL